MRKKITMKHIKPQHKMLKITRARPYLNNIVNGEHRYNLAGEPVSEISEEHKAMAIADIEKQKVAQKLRKGQAQKKAQNREMERVNMLKHDNKVKEASPEPWPCEPEPSSKVQKVATKIIIKKRRHFDKT